MIKNKNYKSSQPLAPSEKVKGNLTTLHLSVRLYFQIELHRKDEAILESIQSALGVGKIYRTRPDTSMLQVSSFKDMSAVLDFFDKYPLPPPPFLGDDNSEIGRLSFIQASVRND